MQLRLARRGKASPFNVSMQRQWPANFRRHLPPGTDSMTFGVTSRGHFEFRSTDTTAESAFISRRHTQASGLNTVSPDGRLFARVARLIFGTAFCVEVYSLQEGKVVSSAMLDASNFRAIRFSPDSQKVLVGTRDTIESLDIASSRWDTPVSLTATEERDRGRVVNRRIPLGFGLPGDLFTTRREVVYSRPAALHKFDVSPTGTLAVGSESGEIVLLSLASGERLAVVGTRILGSRPDLIRFSPTGEHLVAYAKGILHIFKLGTANENSEIVADSDTPE